MLHRFIEAENRELSGTLYPIILRFKSAGWLKDQVCHIPLYQWLVRSAATRPPDNERAAAESEWLAVIEDLDEWGDWGGGVLFVGTPGSASRNRR